MEPAIAALAAAATGFGEPVIPVVSTVTGELAGPGEMAAPGYWADQARMPVRFAAAVRALAGQGVTTFVEAGPGGALSAAGPDCLPPGAGEPRGAGRGDAAFIALQRDDTAAALLTAVGAMPRAGGERRLAGVVPGRDRAGRPADLRVPAGAVLAAAAGDGRRRRGGGS